MMHELKTWCEYYAAIESGEKTFEIRKFDRPFKVGDILLLKEWKPLGYSYVSPSEMTGEYTGREMKVKITYILAGENAMNFGLFGGYCIMSIININ